MHLIVVGLDSSPRAPGVLTRAAALAQATGAKLLVLRAVGLPTDLPPELYGISPDAVPEKLTAATQADLERLVAAHASAVPVEVDARIGTPWRTLCSVAADRKADLIIVGTHGHTVLDSLLGTTAARTVNHAPCSVLVVREPPPA
jgi:nucleotide-binding universal stress UspA family protein